ncbi:hypothetical protein QYM18_05995 [Ectopseudomonas chengduensis]|nr:hypothetical protein [Pseudomonas chengduensis]WKC38639.1 hypothetical protein QYM18_05995 [Pseudomonas chengduensis]
MVELDFKHLRLAALESEDEPMRAVILSCLKAIEAGQQQPESFLYVMRAIAFSTPDYVLGCYLLEQLGETRAEALSALATSCWDEDLSVDELAQAEMLRDSLLSLVPTGGTHLQASD